MVEAADKEGQVAEPLLNPALNSSQVETTEQPTAADETKEEASEGPKKPELNERLGLMYMMVTITIGVIAQSVSSWLFLENPTLSLWQVLVVRCGVSMLLGFAIMAGQQTGIKDQMWNKIQKGDFPKICLRLMIASLGIPLSLLGLKYFPASIVRAGMSLQPVFALILADFMLPDEKADARDVITIFISMVAVYLIMNRQVRDDIAAMDIADGGRTTSYNIALFGLFLVPLLQALGRIQIKQMKSITPIALTTYLNINMTVVGLIGVFVISPPGEGWANL